MAGARERLPRRREKAPANEMNLVDLPFTLLVLILVAIGLVMVFSASFAQELKNAEGERVTAGSFYFRRQCLFALVGCAAMFAVCRFDYRIFRNFKVLSAIYLITVILLLAVLVIGTRVNGAKRWIALGPLNIQPSEIAKLCVILVLSSMLSNLRDNVSNKKLYIYLGGSILILLGLVAIEKHLSAIIIIVLITAVMLFIAGVPLRYLLIVGGAAAAGVGVYLATNSYALRRLTSFMDPWQDASDSGYQIVQALYAIGPGGLLGLGFGNSRQKYLYLPEPHNDYIFAVICEELGFVGAGIILLLFILLIVRGYWIAAHARDRFGALLVAGLMTQLSLQVFLNVCVVTNILPSTGISLPFISYGGSALILQMVEMGVVMSVSRSCDNRLLADHGAKPAAAKEE